MTIEAASSDPGGVDPAEDPGPDHASLMAATAATRDVPPPESREQRDSPPPISARVSLVAKELSQDLTPRFQASYSPPSTDVLHPRGRIWPPLPDGASVLRRAVRNVVRLGQGLYYHEVFRAAPAMAFHFFLSLLPLLAFIGYVVGIVAQRQGVDSILAVVLDRLPTTTEAVLKSEVMKLANAGSLGPIAAVGFIWIAAGGTHGLMDAVELVVGAQRRAWWKQRLHAIAWVMGFLIVVAIASFGLIQWEALVHSSDVQAGSLLRQGAFDPRSLVRGGFERFLTFILSLVAAICGLAAFYRFSVSHSHRVRRRAFPGAFLAVALCMVVSWAFGLYIGTLVNYTVYYGSLAVVAVLLVWLWLMSLAILVGAELNAQLEGLRDVQARASERP